MRILSILIFGLVTSLASAATVLEAQNTAEQHLGAAVHLDQESTQSYFFITGNEGDSDYPCIRGVIVNKESGQLVSPESDPEIDIYFSYSNTYRQDLVVINCAN